MKCELPIQENLNQTIYNYWMKKDTLFKAMKKRKKIFLILDFCGEVFGNLFRYEIY